MTIEILLLAMTVWCAVADECWVIRSGSLEHSTRFLAMRRVSRYTDARLAIVQDFSKWSKPYCRMYAVVDRERHFLIERSLPELETLATFINEHTGWPALPNE